MPHSCPWEEPACSGESVRATETGDDGAPRPSGQGHSPSPGPAPRPRYGRGKTDEAGWRTPEGRMALTRTCFYPRRAPFQRHLPLLGEAPALSFTQVSSDDSPCFAVTRERPDALAFRRSLALRTQLWLRSHVLSEHDTCRPTSSGAAAVSDGKPARHLARWHPAGNALSLWLPVRCLLSR